jgi:murein DD-endopeptidase MepM/ murein hydrolase activator NlpD
MAWPILGEIAMAYSRDRVIYDLTLDQWRTNEVLCIAASLGDVITAAADGRVTEIYYSFESGITMTIDHGNGWHTTYSRLGANTIAQIGDVVYMGEPIAYVGDPPIYSILLGHHLGFMVTKDSSSVNPNMVCSN